jgi:hypothetical protein
VFLSSPFMLNSLSISYFFPWPFQLYLAKSTSYEDPQHAVLSNLVSLNLPSVQIFSSAPCSQTPSACHNSRHGPSSCLSFKTQLNSIGLSVPHRKHITSPLRAQQVNAIYRFVPMVY